MEIINCGRIVTPDNVVYNINTDSNKVRLPSLRHGYEIYWIYKRKDIYMGGTLYRVWELDQEF